MHLTTAKLETALQVITDQLTNQMPYADRLDLLGTAGMFELLSLGFDLHTGRRAKVTGVLNVLNVPPYAFIQWMAEQPEKVQLEYERIMKTQASIKRNELIHDIENSIDTLHDMEAGLGNDLDSAKVKASVAEKKARIAGGLISTLDDESNKQAGDTERRAVRDVHVHVYEPSDSSKDRLKRLRDASKDD